MHCYVVLRAERAPEALIETPAVDVRPAVHVGADAEYIVQVNHESKPRSYRDLSRRRAVLADKGGGLRVAWACRESGERVRGGDPGPSRKPRELSGITDRERDVLRLVGQGMSNTEIAATLYITAGTAKTHAARLLAKLGARDRVQLVITAYQAGLLDT